MSFRNYFDSSSYGRNRDTNRSAASSTTNDRPTTVTAKYTTTTPSYKSSSIPILNSEKNAKDESPITAIANKYANYNKTEKPSSKYEKYETKKDYSKLSAPMISSTKSRDPSPVSTSKYRPSRHLSPDRSLSRTNRHTSPDRSLNRTTRLSSPDRSLSRAGRHLNHASPDRSLTRPIRHTSPDRSTTRSNRNLSPDRRNKSLKDKIHESSLNDRDKDIPSKTEKSTGYNSLSNYKLYPRTSNYTRPTTTHAPRTDSKPEITINRYAIANRLNSNYLRSPPTVKRSSLSPINHIDVPKRDKDSSISPVAIIEEETKHESEPIKENHIIEENDNGDETETVSVVTRHTSPTPPGSSAYVRTRRADMAKTVEKSITRAKRKPTMVDKEIQSDRLDDPTRSSRFGSTARTSMTNWSYYSPNNYTGYAGRYSTQYANLRENSNNDRSSRSHSTEPQPKTNSVSPYSELSKDKSSSLSESNPQVLAAVYEQNKSDDSSEIIINVNLKLTRAKSPTAAPELVSPEITITNTSNLPPQAPKSENAVKIKKVKARKSSTDSTSDSSPKKKSIKKRSKSVSSTDSDQGSEVSEKSSPPKSIPKKSSSSGMLNGSSKSKHSKSRESNSPESSTTFSTQSSISEDESISKSKAVDASRTSADETSLPTDRTGRHPSPLPQKSENEEAKSFLIRALAPVTNLFKMRQSDSNDNSRWPENSTSESTGKDVTNLVTESDRSSKSKNIIAFNDDNLVQLKGIRPLDGYGEGSWNGDSESNKNNSNITRSESMRTPSEKNIPRLIRRVESGEKAWWMESNSDNKSNNNQLSNTNNNDSAESSQPLKKYKFADDEKPWWLDSCANIPEGIERLTPPRKSSSDSDKSEKYNFFKVRHIESGDKKDWWVTSNENSLSSNKPDSHSLNKSGSGLIKSGSDRSFPMRRIRHIESGERPWWLASNKDIPEGIEKLPTPPPEESESDSSDSEEVQVYTIPTHIPPFPIHLVEDEPLGARRSPEGLETPKENEEYRGRTSPYENNRQFRRSSIQKGGEKYISRYTDIDDILGTSGQIYSPFMDSILAKRTGQLPYEDDECEEIDPTQVRIHDSTPQMPVIKKIRSRSNIVDYREEDQLDDATLQVFKDGDYGPYLDLDSTLGEQDEELEGLQDSRKNALVLRTQLSVRVHTIIERLLTSQGRELRRALFTLKQILQSDKDLVHEFVENKGLDCLMQVGNTADHNYLDYILRALGQILLYVDGMHGVMEHKHCLQWLYSLISSKFRHVVKTSLKLLLVFVEYTEKNSIILINAIKAVDGLNGRQPWYNVMKILQDFDASDTELLIYATTLINRCLNNIPDRNTYYDQVDALQDQGMDDIIQLYMSKQGTDLDLLRQLQIFEAVLLCEDGDESGTALKQLDESVINTVRRRSLNLSLSERRKSKKRQMLEKAKQLIIAPPEPETKPIRSSFLPSIMDNKENKELSSALRRRRDRFARQANHIEQQELYNSIYSPPSNVTNGPYNNSYTNKPYTATNGIVPHYTNGTNGSQDEEDLCNRTTKNFNLADVLKNGNQRYTAGLKQRIQNGTLGHSVTATDAITVIKQKLDNTLDTTKDDREVILKREHSIKDLAQRLTSPISPTTEEKPLRVSDMAGIVSKAKEELAKSQSKEVIKSPTIEKSIKVPEIKISENDLHWEELKKGCLSREFHLCDLDFADLREDSDEDILSPAVNIGNGPPPPPPGLFPPFSAPPPLPNCFAPPKPVPTPPKTTSTSLSNESDSSTIKKNKKTVKLFWKEIQENPAPPPIRSKIGGLIWDDLPDIKLDTAMLEHLFESRTNELILKKLMEPKKTIILDAKRSNAINIAMKKLPTPQTIKAAIMKMDATVIGREGIEKLLTMLPTDEEKIKIQEAQYANPDLPLDSAEQFLLTLASINELSSRLKLWVFKLDFDNLVKEVAEPVMDLKQGIELLKVNKTFKVILSTLRSVGSFLNGCNVKGFRLEYLSKVMEVKDTVHKHPLLYHICEMIIEKFPDCTDLFSEVGPVIRASKVDFDILRANLQKLESDCKASWDHMKRVAKHDGSQIFKTKINEFLTDAAEKIILLTVIKKRVMNRYVKLLLHMGVPLQDIAKTKPSEYFKLIAEFALEFRTTRERVLQQLEKRANHRERNKTRGKMIIDVGNYQNNKNGDHTADRALKELLKTDPDTDSLTSTRRKYKPSTKSIFVNGDLSPDDEIFESLVRCATSKQRQVPRERRKNRISDKKSLNRTLDGHQSWPGRESSPGVTMPFRS